MTRWRRLAALAALAAVVVGACSSDDTNGEAASSTATSQPEFTFTFDGVAATIDGQEIDADTLAAQLDLFRQYPELARAALGVDEVSQPGTDEPQPALVADLLNTELAAAAIRAEVAERGLEVTEEDRRIADQNVKAAYIGVPGELPDDYLEEQIDRYAHFVTLDRDLQPEITEEELREAYESDPDKWERACASHILVTSEEEAEEILDELSSGGDFAELASERSQDPGSAAEGGDLGCLAPGETVGPFDEALWSGSLGEVLGPIQTEFGYHLIRVDERGQQSFEVVRDDIETELRSRPFDQLGAWVVNRLVRAEVTIDERYGSWDERLGAVVPLGGTPEGLELTPSQGGDGAPSSTTSTTGG